MRITDRGWLDGAPDEPVEYIATRRTTTLDGPSPLGAVFHWTASRGKTDDHARNLAKGIADGGGPSWHVLIARSGLIVQSASFLVGTNHVGRMGDVAGGRRSVNRNTVGIELENAGCALKVGEKFFQVENPQEPRERWRPTALELPAVEVVDGCWHGFTVPQERAAEAVLRALVDRFGWPRLVCSMGHRDFDPGRKADPGDLWARTLSGLLDRVFGAAS